MTKQTKNLLMAGGAAALAFYFLGGKSAAAQAPVATGNYIMVGDGDPVCPKAGPLVCGKLGGAVVPRGRRPKMLAAMGGTVYQGLGSLR